MQGNDDIHHHDDSDDDKLDKDDDHDTDEDYPTQTQEEHVIIIDNGQSVQGSHPEALILVEIQAITTF